MKKTFCFVALIGLMIAVMLSTASCLGNTDPHQTTPETTIAEPTTPAETTTEETTPEETTPPEPIDPDKPEGAVLVDSINGKSFSEQILAFSKEFEEVESYDWFVSVEAVEDGVPVSEYVSLKFYNGEFIACAQQNGVLNEIHFVNGMLYISRDGQKMKLTIENPDDILGEGYVEGLKDMFSTFPEFSEDEATEADANHIYLLNNVYYVTVHETDEESGEEVSILFQFNAMGELIRIEGTSEKENYTFVVNSYNKPVTITPPSNAGEYVIAGNTAVPEGAVPIALLNGMNATELFEKFVQEYSSAQTFDIEMTVKQSANGATVTSTVSVKLGEDALYYNMSLDGESVELWMFEDISYLNYNGQKTKQVGLKIEDFLGEGALEDALLSVISEIPEAYYTNLAEAQIYYLNGLYFFTVMLHQSGMGMISEIVMFDANGNVVRIIDQTDELYMDYTVNGYGKPVEILPPADADSYVAEGETPDNTIPTLPQTEEEIYALYSNMCLALQNADSYTLCLLIDGLEYLDYAISGEDAYVMFYNESGNLERWLIGGVGYFCDDGTTVYRAQMTQSFLNIFTSVKSALPIGIIDRGDMSNLRCTYDTDYDEIIVWFDILGDDGEVTYCKYALFESDGYAYIEIIYTFTKDGQVIEDDYFFFDAINDHQIKIELP